MGKMLKPDYSKLFDMARDVYALPSYKSNSGAAFMPLRYSLELTYRCNLSCPYCYVGNFERKEELSASDWKAIINQIPFYGLITLVGGEPLIRKDFDEIFDAAIARVIGKVNVDNNPGVSNMFGIRNIPTVLFIKNGKMADKQVGVCPKQILVNKLNALL